MNCSDVGFGTYDCAYNIMLPYLIKDPCEPDRKSFPKTIAVDKCLLPEILSLWEQGIKTTGCCCGHGHLDKAFIGVKNEHIPRMKKLGYCVYSNSCRPGDEDSFVPKMELKYGSADKGFNWWEESR
mgnify:CR=1 FL=1